MKRIEFGEFRLSDKSRQYVNEVLDSNWLTMGQKTKDFETAFANLFNYPHCRAVSSGTMADTLSCMALHELGAKNGDEIICPALSFIATAESIRAANFVPVFVDVGYNLQINTDLIEQAITPRTKGITSVNLMGKTCKLDIIQSICKKHNLYHIVDNCEGYGAKYNGKHSLEYADFETTSHYIAHIVMAGGEFGSVFTKNPEHDKLIEAMRSHGRVGGSLWFDHKYWGVNGKPVDISAAIALGELEDFDNNWNIRTRNMKFFRESFRGYEDLVYFVEEDENCLNAPHGFNIIFKNPKNTSLFYEDMERASIHIKKTFGSMATGHKAFSYLGYQWGDFPVAEYIGENSFHWGVHKYLTDNDLGYVVEKVKESFDKMKGN